MKTVSNRGDRTDAESMESIRSNINGMVKEGHHVRKYVGKTRPTPKVLH